MNKTVAIIGSHPKTRGEFDFDREDVDVWVFNEACKEEFVKRADGVFQLHKPVIWRSETNRNDKNHYKWLKSGETPVVYMQEKYDDVPMSERYPIEEVLALAPGLAYFTSSVSYAIALAIYKGYTNIEIYGVEMATNTEYAHQRPGVAFWVGIAVGRGINVEFHGELFHSPMYGYEGDIQIPLEYYKGRLEFLGQHVEGSKEAVNKTRAVIAQKLGEFIKSYKADLTDLDAMIIALGKNAHTYGMVNGAQQVDEKYLAKCEKMIEESGDYLIVRQEFEGQLAGASRDMPKLNEKLKYTAEVLDKKRKALNTNDNKAKREKLVEAVKKAIDGYNNAMVDLALAKGVMQENKMLIKEYDTYLKTAGITPEKGTSDEQS